MPYFCAHVARSNLCRMQEVGDSGRQDSIFLYFHTKGMVNHGRHTARPAAEADLFERTIIPWREVVKVFKINATVTRVGEYPAPAGWIWVNFWWARTSYVQSLTEPIRSKRRHYYEDWLGRLYDNTTSDNDEPGHFGDCSTCFSMNRDCGGYGVTFLPETLGKCHQRPES